HQVARIQAEQLGNVPHAIASLGRALECKPTDVMTLCLIADLYERDGQASAAVNQLQRIVKLSPSPDVLRETHMRLATLWDSPLGNRGKALVSLQAVLSLNGEHPDALERMAEIYEREARLPEAAATAERLL